MACVLIVDDSVFQRRNVRRILQPDGHEIVEAADGDSALTVIESGDLDYVILGLLMPNVNGLSVLEELKDRPSNPAIIVLT